MRKRALVMLLLLTTLAVAASLPPQLAWIAQTPGLKPVDLRTTYNVSFAVTGDASKIYAQVRDRLKKEGWTVTERGSHDMVRDGQVWAAIHQELKAVKDGHGIEVSVASVKGRPDWPDPVFQVGLADWNLP